MESSDVVTQCPLCHMPMGSKDELQLHYLTSCSGYDKVSNEHPRSKVSNYHQEGSEPAAPPAEPGGLGGMRGLDGGVRGLGDGRGLGGGRGLEGVEPQFPGAASTSATAEDGTPVAKDTQSDCSVQFMWQPTTNITYPCVTLLASFPRGSVDLRQDPEGGHYASKFVNIARGSYEGQLVIGESFVHPIKEFKVSKDDDIIVIQFEFSKECCGRSYGTDFDMQTNPSHSTQTGKAYSVTYPNPTFGNYGYDYGYDQKGKAAGSYQPSADDRVREVAVVGTTAGRSSQTGIPGHSYQKSDSLDSITNRSSSYLLQSSSGGSGHSNIADSRKLLSPTSVAPDTRDAHAQRATLPAARYQGSSAHQSASQTSSLGQRQVEELIHKVEELTLERDTLRSNQGRVQAMFETRTRRQQGGDVVTATDRKAIEELRDRNTALQEQIREYSQTILEQRTLLQSMSENTSNEAKQLLDLTKRQQLVHAESFSEMKAKVEDAMKLHNDYIKVSQMNISLTAELQDYKKQTRILLDEMHQKDEEIGELKHSVAEGSSDRLVLELTTMREKCEGWKEEIDRLVPLEDEVRTLQKENAELGQQVTLLVEEGERQVSSADSGKVMDYDTVMKRMAELQDTRVAMEEELRRLREELTSALQENASLREGSQPQNYASLKTQYESVIAALREAEVAISDEKKMNSQLQSANLELHQKLVSATDPEKLKSIQERMVRYKNERDIARLDLEGAQAQLVTAEIDVKSAQNAFLGYETNMIQLQSKENEIAHLMEECQTYQTRMLGYREERNKYRDHAKSLKQHLKSVEELRKPATPKLEGAELDEGGAEVEHPGSPNHDHHYASPTLDYVPPLDYAPTLDYAPEQYTTELSHHNNREDCESPSDGTVSPTHHRSKALSESYAQAKPPRADSCLYRTVSVMTKGGVMVEMDIQRPSAQLNAKQKPQVVVKRETGFETGTLAFTGRVGGKELAGVIMDVKIAQKPTASSSMDGTCKDGKRYFRCASGFGMYLPLSRVYIEMESATV